MKKYIVGGWNRDIIMGIKPTDKDYVLVGCTPKDISRLISNGFEQVGKDFPVYLSPQGEEYALARTERKTGNGYNGFTVNTAGVTLEQDLSRRDLTINAIAWDSVVKRYIDPFGGQNDIKNKVLKHVSPAFAEDPVRVLRLARFGAKLHDFSVHASTVSLAIKVAPELAHVSTDRIITEFVKASKNNHFWKFLKYLKQFGALDIILPGIVVNDKVLEVLKDIESQGTDAYRFDIMMTYLLKNTVLDNCKLRLTSSTTRYIQKINEVSPMIGAFRSSSVQGMVDFFNKLSVRNNGGEEYLVKVLEYFVLNKIIDVDTEHNIFLAYDAYSSVRIPDIDAMIKAGKLKNEDITNFVNTLRYKSISAIFK